MIFHFRHSSPDIKVALDVSEEGFSLQVIIIFNSIWFDESSIGNKCALVGKYEVFMYVDKCAYIYGNHGITRVVPFGMSRYKIK